MKKDDLDDAKQQFADSSGALSEARQEWLDDMRFGRLAEQWPEAVRQQREREGRPCLTINRLPSFIRQVVNDSRMNKPAIRVVPVDSGADPVKAKVLGGLIRQIEASSNADVAYDTALEHSVSGGFGFFRVNVAYSHDDSFDQDIRIERVSDPLSIYWDASSSAADAEDWRYAFVTELMPREQFRQIYKGAEEADWEATYRDLQTEWGGEENIRIAEWWTREATTRTILQLSDGRVISKDDWTREIDGIPQSALWTALGLQVVGDRETQSHKIRQRIITGAEVLKETEWAGRYIPIVPVFGEDVLLEGRRHFLSLIRQCKDAQRNFNYWRTSATELVALAPKAPFIGPKGAFNSDADKWETANVRSHAFIEFDGPQPPQRQPFAGVPAGAIQEALSASDDLKSIMGLHDASLGARSNETSGKAIMARQREGDVSTFHFIDNLSRGIRYAGRVIVDLIPNVYNTPRQIRILGEDQKEEVQAVNQTGGMDLTTGKYDVVVNVGPAFTSRREEAMSGMLEMMRVYPPAAPILGDLIAKNADWPNADEVANRLKAVLPPQVLQAEQSNLPPEAAAIVGQMQQQLQQAQQQIQQGAQGYAQLEAKLAQAQSAAAKDQTEAMVRGEEIKLEHAKLQVEQMALQVKREELALKRAELAVQHTQLANPPQVVAAED